MPEQIDDRSTLTISVSVTGIEELKELLLVLARHADQLPPAVIEALHKLTERD